MDRSTDPRIDLTARVTEELRSALDRDDAARLEILEDLYRSLEVELEGDLDKEGSARR